MPRKPIKRSTKPIARTSRPKSTNAYTRPEWRKLVALVALRSRGICEMQVACDGNPAEGDPHHLEYAPFKGWKRLIVPLEQLRATCRRCHLQVHQGE